MEGGVEKLSLVGVSMVLEMVLDMEKEIGAPVCPLDAPAKAPISVELETGMLGRLRV